MAIDQPLTVYPNRDSEQGNGHTEAELDAVTEEWQSRHGTNDVIGKKVSLEELLGDGKRRREKKSN